jgi:hypothetical protein
MELRGGGRGKENDRDSKVSKYIASVSEEGINEMY